MRARKFTFTMHKFTPRLRQITFPLAFSTSFLQAQTSSSTEAPLELEETVVTADQYVETRAVEQANQITAYKTGTQLKDVPQSVSVLTADQIQQQGIDSIGDLIEYTPGVTTSQGEGHRDAVVFRGVRSTADFFVDGVRDDVQYFRSLYNVDQVEVIKGPNSLTFGRGGTGGVLNRVFKKAIIGEDFNETRASLDTFGANSFQFDYNQSLQELAALRLNVHFDNLDNHRDFFDGERIGINPTFTYKLGEDTTATFSYEYADHERFIDRGIPSVSILPPLPAGAPQPTLNELTRSRVVARNLSGITFGDSELNLNDLESHTFRVGLDHKFSDQWKARATAFYGTYDKVYSNFFPSDFENGEVEIDGYIDRTDRQRFTLAGDLVGEFSTGPIEHKLLVGAEYINTSSDQDRFNNVFDSNQDDQQFFDISNGFNLSNGIVSDDNGNVLDVGTFTDLNDDTETTINVYSFFIQDEIALHETLDLIVGARFDSFDIEVQDNDPDTPADQRFLSRTDNEVTPRFGLVYKPIENLSLYASYSESFLPRSGEQFADLGGGDDALDPDTARNLEFGIKWDIQDNLAFTFSYFDIEQSTTDTDPNDAGALVELDTEISGFEAQLKGQITDFWHLSAGYNYIEGEQVGGATDDFRLRELPRHTLSMWNQFQITEDFSFGFGATYQDESFADLNNQAVLPSFIRWDASARYNFSEDFGVQLNVENIFDTDYFQNAHTANNISVGAPVNARITFIGRF